jgi:hypothetical protein
LLPNHILFWIHRRRHWIDILVTHHISTFSVRFKFCVYHVLHIVNHCN